MENEVDKFTLLIYQSSTYLYQSHAFSKNVNATTLSIIFSYALNAARYAFCALANIGLASA